MNIQRDIFSQRGAESSSKPSFPLPVLNQVGSKRTLGTFVAGTDFTVDPGSAGTVIIISLPVAPIINSRGRTGYYGLGELALTGALATTLGIEVPFISNSTGDSGDTTFLNNGEYMVDYETATIYGVRGDSGTTGEANYLYWDPSFGGGSGGSVSITSIIPGTGATNLGKAEDGVHTSGDVGVMDLGVANEAQTTFAADGDYVPHAMDRKGNTLATGNVASAATDAGNPVKTGGKYNSTLPTFTNGQRGDTQITARGEAIVGGTVASGVADLGNPIKTGAVYNTTKPTATNGQRIDAQCNVNGAQDVNEVLAAVAEDNSNGVIATQNKPLPNLTYNLSIDKSAALEASSVTKASAGNLYWVSGRIDSTAPTATYYYQILSAASLPADGAVTFLVAPMKLQHTTGTDTPIKIGNPSNAITPIAGSATGLVECLSSTEFTKTITAAYLSTTVGYF